MNFKLEYSFTNYLIKNYKYLDPLEDLECLSSGIKKSQRSFYHVSKRVISIIIKRWPSFYITKYK